MFSDGMSMALPVVARTVALMIAENLNLSPKEIKKILCDTVIATYAPGKDSFSGAGVINTQKAVESVSNSGNIKAPKADYKNNQIVFSESIYFAF